VDIEGTYTEMLKNIIYHIFVHFMDNIFVF